MKRMRIALALPFAVAFAVTAAACFRSDGGDGPATTASPDASATASPTTATASATTPATRSAAATTSPAAGEPDTWKVAAAEPLPQNVVVYIEKGCYQCDGPAASIERVTSVGNPGDVAVSVRELFRAPGRPPAYISSFQMSPDGHETWLTVCSRGYCGGVGQMTPDAQETLYHSDDGGITWSEIETFDGSVGVAAVVSGIPVMARTRQNASGQFVTSFFALQGGNEVSGPPQSYLAAWTPDELFWQAENGLKLMHTDGTVVFESDRGFTLQGNPHPSGDTFVVTFQGQEAGAPLTYSLVDGGEVVAEVRAAHPGMYVYPGTWLDERTTVGNAGLFAEDIPGQESDQPQRQWIRPAHIDFETGTITPLALYGDDLFTETYEGRNRVRGYDAGSATASTPYFVVSEGDCLNVREQASLTAGIVRCWAHDVIVWAPGTEPLEADGVTWIPVEGPDGSSGWASAEFLRR